MNVVESFERSYCGLPNRGATAQEYMSICFFREGKRFFVELFLRKCVVSRHFQSTP